MIPTPEQREEDSRREALHNAYLRELISRLEEIGENPDEIESPIIDPRWRNDGINQTLCDLILIYRTQGNSRREASAVELKGPCGKKCGKRNKAIEQIEQGRRYIEQVLGMKYRYGKVVFYEQPHYTHERLD
jgi:hypothetical protein